jgi:hypothetical protein
LQDFIASPRRLHGAMTMLGRLPLPAQTVEPLGLPRMKLGDSIDADTKLDQMDRHSASRICLEFYRDRAGFARRQLQLCPVSRP